MGAGAGAGCFTGEESTVCSCWLLLLTGSCSVLEDGAGRGGLSFTLCPALLGCGRGGCWAEGAGDSGGGAGGGAGGRCWPMLSRILLARMLGGRESIGSVTFFLHSGHSSSCLLR